MLRRSFTCLIAVSAFSALLTFTPPTAHAIPVAGDYVFTSGLTGSFTSDGSRLTDWDFTDQQSRTWSPLTGFIRSNNVNEFRLHVSLSDLRGIYITWDISQPELVQASYILPDGNTRVDFHLAGIALRSSVPEPSGLALLGLGLGLLALYGWCQQRQAGGQVG